MLDRSLLADCCRSTMDRKRPIADVRFNALVEVHRHRHANACAAGCRPSTLIPAFTIAPRSVRLTDVLLRWTAGAAVYLHGPCRN
jgi:hypothetical protein